MKILLISAIDHSNINETVFENLGLAYLASYARSKINNLDFKIIHDNIENVIQSFKPDIIGIGCVTSNYGKAIEIARLAKRYNIFTVIGGIHITMCPQSFNTAFDIGVLGEGEETFTEIIEYKQGKRIIENIKGIIYYDNGLIYNEARSLIGNLDSIPFPARDLLNIDSRNTYMFSSRGCPYNCIFCSSTRFWKKTRFHSAEYVVKEILEVYNKYGCSRISFSDDLFIGDKKRLKLIIELLRVKGLLGKLKFNFNCRANLIDEDMVMMLKEINAVSVNMGLETGSDKVLKYLKGPHMDIKYNKRAVALISKAGIEVSASFIIGCPIDTKETIQETYDFIKNNNVCFFDVYYLEPFPNTPIWDYAVKKGIVSNDMDFSKMKVWEKGEEKIILLCENLTKKELAYEMNRFMKLKKRRIMKLAFYRLFTNPFSLITPIIRKIKFILGVKI
jgi:radical SAM superfamily enzyme YgiQ (UPF0313 family)